MTEPQPFASLGASLLARKGSARPAMRPQTQPIEGASGGIQTIEDLGWNDMGEDDAIEHTHTLLPLTPAPANPHANAKAAEDDRAERAKLEAHNPSDDTPSVPEVRLQQEVLARKIAPVERIQFEEPASDLLVAKAAPRPAETLAAKVSSIEHARTRRIRRSTLDDGRKSAFTLRLDAERHLKLRLACTMRNLSAQQIVTEALDQLLDQMPSLDTLATQVKHQ